MNWIDRQGFRFGRFAVIWLNKPDRSDIFNELRILHIQIWSRSFKFTWFVERCEKPTYWPKFETRRTV